MKKASIMIRVSESELNGVDALVESGYGRSRADVVRRSLNHCLFAYDSSRNASWGFGSDRLINIREQEG